MPAGSFKDLTVYMKVFEMAMEIFETSKSFPKEETYSLTDQIRRSSRSVCVCIAEAYRKRQYEPYFVSKASDGDMENSEPRVWLDFASACRYLPEDKKQQLEEKSVEIGKLLNHMIKNPKKYARKTIVN